MEKIRLMQITHDLAIGGLQQVVVNICKNIDREKFDISVLCLRRGGELVQEVEKLGIKMFILPQPQKTDYFAFLKVAKILRQERIKVIHTHNTQPFIDGVIGAILAGVKRRIHTDHGRIFPDKRRYMFAERIMAHFVDKVVAVSEDTARKLRQYERIPLKKITIIPNGIDLNLYRRAINKEEKRRSLGINSTGPVIGTIARLSEEKGITYLLQAMKSIISIYPKATLLIVGDGPLMDDLVRQSLSLAIRKNVLFLGTRRDIPEILRALDIFVLPSLSEGLPMVILEAMAADCPIVASNTGGIPNALRSYKKSLLSIPGNPQNLAEAVNATLQNLKAAEGEGDTFYKVMDEFSVSRMIAQYESLYLRV